MRPGSPLAKAGQFIPMTVLPMTPMDLSDLAAAGISSQQASDLVRLGVLHRVLHGVYLHRDVPISIENRAACIAKVLPDHAVVCDHTAAWLWGVDCQPSAALDAPLDLDVVRTDGRDRTTRSGVHGGKRALREEEIWEVGGVPVTSPVRTACDLACRRGRRQALAVLDAFMHSCGVTKADYRAMLTHFRGRRGCTQLRELVEYADPRAESLRESWVRMEIINAGLPMPQPQVWVRVPELGRRRLDLGYAGRLIAVEHDGDEHHSQEEDVESDDERRDALRRLGWYIIVVRKEDFDGPRLECWLRELRDVLAERSPSRPRRYARAERRRTWR